MKTRKQKTLRRGFLALFLALLCFLLLYGTRLHSPAQAQARAEQLLGIQPTEVIAQHEGADAFFYLCRNEHALFAVQFYPWMYPSEALQAAVDLSKDQGDSPILGTWLGSHDPDTNAEYFLIIGRIDWEGAATVRAYFHQNEGYLDGEIIKTRDGQQYFWLWQEGTAIKTWEEGVPTVRTSLPDLDRLALLDAAGNTIYSVDYPFF